MRDVFSFADQNEMRAAILGPRRIVVSGRGSPYGKQGRLRLLNPRYELL